MSSRLESLRARLDDLRESDAFAPAERAAGSAVSVERVAEDIRVSRRRYRGMCAAFGAVVAVLVVASLCIPFTPGFGTFTSPSDVLDAYWLFFRMNVLPLFDPTQANLAAQAYGDFSQTHEVSYDQITMRFLLTVLTVACGYMLAVSGLLFQSAFRNPLAVPTSLGVSDGVSLGYVLFLFLGYRSMVDAPGLFFACAYGGGVAVLLFVLFASRFVSGSKTYNVFDMLLIGTVISQMFGGLVTFVTNYFMDEDTWDIYYELLQSIDMTGQPATYVIALAVCVIATVPIVARRFQLNLISFPDSDGRMMGARPGLLRGLALVCGSVMQLVAIVSIGQVAMVSLAVPFLCRLVFPADFRRQLLGNFLIGSLVLLLCQFLTHFAVFGSVPVPIGTVVGVVIMPFFVWMMAMTKRTGWSE